MSKKFFQPVRMESQFVDSKLHGVIFQSAGANAAVDDGAFVVLGDFVNEPVYSWAFTKAAGAATNVLDFNTRNATAPTAVTGIKEACVIDLAEVPTATNGDLVYRIGVRTIGLTNAAGNVSRARKLVVDDVFKIGSENASAELTVGEYATFTANSTVLTPSDDAAEVLAGLYFKVINKETISQGVNANVTAYTLLVMSK